MQRYIRYARAIKPEMNMEAQERLVGAARSKETGRGWQEKGGERGRVWQGGAGRVWPPSAAAAVATAESTYVEEGQQEDRKGALS